VVIDLTAVEKLVDSMRDVVDLVAAEESSTPPAPRRRGIADPFTLARR
jgi:hypothetical protein